MTSGNGRLALTVDQLEHGEYHFVLLEAATVPGDLLSFRPREIGEKSYAKPLDAWFAGVGAVRRATKA